MFSPTNTWRAPGHNNIRCIVGRWGMKPKVGKIISQGWLWRPMGLWDGCWRDGVHVGYREGSDGLEVGWDTCLYVCMCVCVQGSARWKHPGLATGWTRCLSPAGGVIHTTYVYVLPTNGPSPRSARAGDRMRPLVPSVFTWVLLSLSTCICVLYMCVCGVPVVNTCSAPLLVGSQGVELQHPHLHWATGLGNL